MLRHEDNLVSRLSGNTLQPLAGISVTVTDNVTGLPASLYSDNGVTPITQAIVTDNDGYFGFYAPDGSYTLTFTGVRVAPFTRQIVLDDPKDNPYATKAELAAGSGSNLVTFTQADSGAFPVSLQAHLRRYVTFNNLTGADSSGATVSDQAFATAATMQGVDVVFKGGTWKFGSDIIPNSGGHWRAEGGAILLRDTASCIKGNQPTLTLLTAAADLDAGIDRITLSAGSYAAVSVGDRLYVKDRQATNADYIQDYVAATSADLNDPSKGIYQVQVFKVIAKLGSNKVLLDSAAAWPYPLTTTGAIYKVGAGVIEQFDLEGFTLRNGAGLAGSGSEAAFINMTYGFNVGIRNNIFDLGGMTGGYYGTVGSVDLVGNEFRQAKWIAAFLRQAMPNSKVRGNTFKAQASHDASVFIEAHNHNISIIGNDFDGSQATALADGDKLISAVQCDAKVKGVTLIGNNVSGYGVGFRFEMGCSGIVASNNNFRYCDIAGLRYNQSSNNTANGNTFENCGGSATPGALANACGAITSFDSNGNSFGFNTIINDASHVAPAYLVNGDRNKVAHTTFSGAGPSVITGSHNYYTDNTGTTRAGSQIVMVTGPTSHHNHVDRNDIKNLIACTYGVRIDNGSECNYAISNAIAGAANAIGLTGTTNTQTIKYNAAKEDSTSGSKNVCNVAIQAPAMPVNAVMPRRFRIYSTVTTAGAHLSEAQGQTCWEFVQLVDGVGNRFVKTALTATTVDI